MNARQRRQQERSWRRSSLKYLRELRAIKCKCGNPIDWYYSPSGINKRWGNCDTCIERGCSCTAIYENCDVDGNPVGEPKWEMDDDGRMLPCCEFESLRWTAQQHEIPWEQVSR